MEPLQELLKEFFGPALGAGGVVGAFVYFRKYDKDLRQELREDNKRLRDDSEQLRRTVHKQDNEIYRLHEIIRKGDE